MQNVGQEAFGIAAFAIVEKLIDRLLDKQVLNKSEALAILNDVARRETVRGLKHNSDPETAAAELASGLALAIRKRFP